MCVELDFVCVNSCLTLSRLRVRVKAMQQVIETQSNRLATFTAESEAASLCRQDESTGQGDTLTVKECLVLKIRGFCMLHSCVQC